MSEIADLFSRDPLSYTKDGGEVKAIVAKMREARASFNLGSVKAGNLKAPKTPRQKAVAAVSSLKIGGNLQALLNKAKS